MDCRCISLVSSTFTSFSNDVFEQEIAVRVWYLLLLHHSQTSRPSSRPNQEVWYLLLLHHSQTAVYGVQLENKFGIFYFYIILKHERIDQQAIRGLVSSTFTSFSNLFRQSCRWCRGLVSSTFTSFSNSLFNFFVRFGGLVSSTFTSFSNRSQVSMKN